MAAGVQVKMAVFMVMLIPALYQVIKFTILYYRQPTTTTTVSSLVPYDQFNQILVCTRDWLTLNSPLTEDGAAYLAGYSTTNALSRFGPKREPYRHIALNETSLERSRSEYEKVFGGRNAVEVIANISTLTALHHQPRSTEKIRVPITLHYASIGLACGYVPRYQDPAPENSLLHNENAEGALRDNPEFWIITDTNGLLSEGNEDSVNFVSFFFTENFPFLRLTKHFVEYSYDAKVDEKDRGGKDPGNGQAGDGGGEMTTDPGKQTAFPAKDIIIKVDIHRNSYIETRHSKCLNETGSRNPTGFLHRMCTIECEEEAFNKVFNCTTFTFFQQKNISSNLPPCHLYDSKLPGKVDPFPSIDVDTNETEMVRVKDSCVTRRDCQAQRHCDEYDIKVRSITIGESKPEMRADTFDKSEHVLHRVRLVLPDEVVVAQEQLQIDIETWIGTVGGIIGIYVGWSLITLFEALSSAWAWAKERKKRTEELGLKH